MRVRRGTPLTARCGPLITTILNGAAGRWLRYRLGMTSAVSQTTEAERECLSRHARGRHNLVELGVMHGVTTALLRRVMAAAGVVSGIDPHPCGRLGVERLTAARGLAMSRRGQARLIRLTSSAAAAGWQSPIDFLFIDADHSWAAIERDWSDWIPHVSTGGIVALHDSHQLAGRDNLDTVRFTEEIVLHDPRVRRLEVVDSHTILERTGEVSPFGPSSRRE